MTKSNDQHSKTTAAAYPRQPQQGGERLGLGQQMDEG
jgi:hypothetical protein